MKPKNTYSKTKITQSLKKLNFGKTFIAALTFMVFSLLMNMAPMQAFAATKPTISIGSPSIDLASGKVTYTVTYSNNTEGITLAPDNVTLNMINTAAASKVEVTQTGTYTRNVIISGISGNGTLGISLVAQTAFVKNGQNYLYADAKGPSETFIVDNRFDKIAPIITLNGNATVTVEVGGSYTDAGATANDNYDGNITNKIVKAGTVNTNKVGSYSLTYNVTDSAGNQAVQVTRTVNVVDTTKPVITLKGSSTLTVELGKSYTDDGATASDNYDGDITIKIVYGGTVNTSKVGSYTLTYDVKDANNNSAVQVIRTVNVEDTTAPTLTLSQSTTDPVDSLTITASGIDANGIDTYKYAEGEKDAAYFNNTGTTFETSFNVNRNGIYTVYVKDTAGNETVATITVSNIKTYTVTFKDYNETIYGTVPNIYSGQPATAPNVPDRIGYTLAGWEVNKGEPANIANITADTIVYANWTLITGLTVNAASTNGTVTGQLPSYTFGDIVKLTATADSGYKFVSWTDSTNKVLSTNPTYSFAITQNTELSANFAEYTVFTVTFYNDANQIISTQTVEQGDDAIEPTRPTKANYTFVKWDKSFVEVQSNLKIYPIFTSNQVTYTLTVFNGINTVTSKYNASSNVAVTAVVPAGQAFTGWKDETGSIISYDQIYNFRITSNKILTATFSPIPAPKPVPTISLDNSVIQMNIDNISTYSKLYFTSTVAVPSGYQLIECGTVVSKTISTDLTRSNALATLKSTAQNSAGQFYSIFNVTYGTTIYVRSYIIYKDLSTGEIITKYSTNIVTATSVKPQS